MWPRWVRQNLRDLERKAEQGRDAFAAPCDRPKAAKWSRLGQAWAGSSKARAAVPVSMPDGECCSRRVSVPTATKSEPSSALGRHPHAGPPTTLERPPSFLGPVPARRRVKSLPGALLPQLPARCQARLRLRSSRPRHRSHDHHCISTSPSTLVLLAIMATIMFRDFSFDAARPSSVHDAERAAMNVSPMSNPPGYFTRLPTPPPCSMGELAQRLDQQSLRVDPAYKFPNEEPPTPPSDQVSFSTSLHELPQRPSYSRITTATLRMQRQANVRMQCSSSHIDDISTLVQRMIEDEDQCNICEPKSPISTSSSSNADEDEGVDMDYSPPSPREPPLPTLKFRRSGDRLNGCASVTKSVRMRKKSKIAKRSSR